VERIAGADVPVPYAANLERLVAPQVSILPNPFRTGCDTIKSQVNGKFTCNDIPNLTELFSVQVEDIVRAVKRACYRSSAKAASA